ncbi:hypothetical protein EDB83DRAFT_2383637 [Lactarius deliciosus]|nr:hypothetical protein EDB83DRAFT_2383637 [Lactarius deliciosus]
MRTTGWVPRLTGRGGRTRARGGGQAALGGSCWRSTSLHLHAPPPHDPTLRSRSSVWYQRTDYLCCYTGALLRLLKVYKSSRGCRRSPYIFRSTFLGLVSAQCLSAYSTTSPSMLRALHAHANLRALDRGSRCAPTHDSHGHSRREQDGRRDAPASRRSHRLIRASSYLGCQAEGRVRVTGMAGDVLPALS